MSARLQKEIQGSLSEMETDITSESDTRMLNSAQNPIQVMYVVIYVQKSFRAGYKMNMSR